MKNKILVGLILAFLQIGLANAEDQFTGWLEDVNGDGVSDIVFQMRPPLVAVTTKSLIFNAWPTPNILCAAPQSGYEECEIERATNSIPSQRYQVTYVVNTDGTIDYFLRAPLSGLNSFLMRRAQDGALAVIGQIEKSELDGVDISQQGKDVVFIGINGSESVGIEVEIGGQYSYAANLDHGEGGVKVGSLYRSDIESGREIRGETRVATIPDSSLYEIKVNDYGRPNLKIPLALPLGLHGKPLSLSINYVGGRDSILGRGWALSGIPQIYRCGAEKSVDRRISRYRFDDGPVNDGGDMLCGQNGRLIPVTSETQSGVSGKFRYHGLANSWVRINESGATEVTAEGSRIDFVPGNQVDGSKVLNWLPDKIKNTMGGEVYFDFIEGAASITPSVIQYDDVEIKFEYAVRPSLPILAGAMRNWSEEGTYNLALNNDKLLKKISVYIRDKERKELNFGYKFINGSQAPVLNFFQECGVGSNELNDCLVPVEFSYTNEESKPEIDVHEEYLQFASSISSGWGGNGESLEVDFDGDGVLDFIRVKNVNSQGKIRLYLSSQGYAESQLGRDYSDDKNKMALTVQDRYGDGRYRLIYLERADNKVLGAGSKKDPKYATSRNQKEAYESAGYNCVQTHGTLWECTKTINYPGTTYATFDWKYVTASGFTSTLVEEAFCEPASSAGSFISNAKYLRPVPVDTYGAGYNYYLIMPQGSGCGTGEASWFRFGVSGNRLEALSSVSNVPYAQPVDINGDGRKDLIFLNGITKKWDVSLSDSSQVMALGTDHDVKRSFPIDINADGKTDILIADNDENGVMSWFVKINTGAGFNDRHRMSNAGNVLEGLNRKQKEDLNARVFDYDGDLYPDVLLSNKGESYIIYRTNFDNDGALFFDIINTGVEVKEDPKNIRVSDIDGDTKNDIVEISTINGVTKIRVVEINQSLPGLLAAVSEKWPNAGEKSTKINWGLTSNVMQLSGSHPDGVELYTRKNIPLLPSRTKFLTRPIPVVQEVRSPNATGGEKSVSYRYNGAVVGMYGFGFLGFEKIDVTDLAAGTFSIKEFSPFQSVESPVYALNQKKITKYRLENSGGSGLLTGAIKSRSEFGVKERRVISCPSVKIWLDHESEPSCYKAYKTYGLPEVVASRSTIYDFSGDEIRSERTQYLRDGKGRITNQRREIGLGSSSDECLDVDGCLALDNVVHVVNKQNEMLYPSTNYTGPLLAFTDKTITTRQWSGPLQSLTGLGGEVVASSLMGPRSDVVDPSWRTDLGTTTWKVWKESTVLNPDSELPTNITPLYTGSGQNYRETGRRIAADYRAVGSARPDFPDTYKANEWDQHGFPKRAVNGSASAIGADIVNDRLTGVLLQETDDNGLAVSRTVDFTGMVLSAVYQDGSSSNQYREFCDYSCPPNAVKKIEIYQYDGTRSVQYLDFFNQTVAEKIYEFNGDESWVHYSYDERGRVLKKSLPTTADCLYSDCQKFISWRYDDAEGIVENYMPNGGITRSQVSARPGGGVIQRTGETIVGSKLGSGGSESSFVKLVAYEEHKDVAGNTLRTVESAGGEDETFIEYAYNPDGDLVWSRINGKDETVVVRDYDVNGNQILEVDPSAGKTEFVFNVLNQLVTEKHFSLSSDEVREWNHSYDEIGRLISRSSVTAGSSSHYVYDTNRDGSVCGLGFLCEEYLGNGQASYQYRYNLVAGLSGAGKVKEKQIRIASETGVQNTFDLEYGYTQSGNIETIKYPNDVVVDFDYKEGLLHRVKSGNGEKNYWTANEYSSWGSLEEVAFGNGVIHEQEYDPDSGQLLSQKAYFSGHESAALQANKYGFDSRGNLSYRILEDTGSVADHQKPFRHYREGFSYDSLDRLRKADIFRQPSEHDGLSKVSEDVYGYDDFGNIRQFPNNGAYHYSEYSYSEGTVSQPGIAECANALASPGVHAVRKIGETTYCYNGFGEVVSVGDRNYTWDGNNSAPVGITDAGGAATFMYGPGGSNDYYRVVADGKTTEKWMPDESYEVVSTNGVETSRVYVGDFLIIEKSNSVTKERYLLKDRLGSTELVMEAGQDAESLYNTGSAFLSYMPFGGRRLSDWSVGEMDNAPIEKGFTGHEHLDSFSLIHMNGRVYDPEIGRFLSPDIFVQNPFNSQSYNRYSYVMNRPMRFVDPSGYFFSAVDFGYTNEHSLDFLGNTNIINPSITLEAWATGLQYEAMNLGESLSQVYSDFNTFASLGSAIGEAATTVVSADHAYGQVGNAMPSLTPLCNATCQQDNLDRMDGLSNVPGPVGALYSLQLADHYVSNGDYFDASMAALGVVPFAKWGGNSLRFGNKLDFLFGKVDPSNIKNLQRSQAMANKIGIADTPANRNEVMRLFNAAYNNPSTIVPGGSNVPGRYLHEFFLPGVTGTGTRLQFVEQNGKVVTIFAR